MLRKNVVKALKIIISRLQNSAIQWVIVGSTNLAIQGIRITPHDIDILVHRKDLKHIQKIFINFSPRPVHKKETTTIPIYETTFEIDGLPIQIFSDGKLGLYEKIFSQKNILIVKYLTLNTPCLKLKAELECYEKTNRPTKAIMIRKFLSTKRF